MRPIALSDEIAVGEVPHAAEIAILAGAGFRSLLNAQPDGEIARFADAATARVATEAAGLAYAHVPIESRLPSEERIKSFADAMATLPRPIYAYCYSGGRAAAAWALAAAPHAAPALIMQALETAGFDATTLRGALERRHAGLPAIEVLAVSPVAAVPVSATVPSAAPAERQPQLAPFIILPRAASEGGFAVTG